MMQSTLNFSKVIFSKFILLLVCLITLNIPLQAQVENAKKWTIKPLLSLHQTNFDWSIAGNAAGTDPNILSELIWKDLKGPGLGLEVHYALPKKIHLKTTNEYYMITKGRVSDTDYADDNRESPFYSDLLNADEGHMLNLNLQLIYEAFTFGKVNINPTVGVAYSQHKFQLLESVNNPSTAGLNSSYKITQRGFDFGTAIGFKHTLFNLSATILGGFYKYGAKANWNLIPDFEKPLSFQHRANSFKITGKFNGSIPLNKQLKLELEYKVTKVDTHSGIDRAFYINELPKETLFNGSKLRTQALSLGISYNF